MPAASLYNKWRPRTFADPDDHPIVGQEHVTRTLRNAVAANQIAHAYLFCGPRGTGKTSAARILARAANCRRGLRGEPCNECENCQALLSGRQLDLLIEIDGASNRGVDDVRALRERIMQRPGGGELTGRYKVYIIDEVHMLTTEAFNALLKSLEEPPPHVIFILATTDPQKVLPTVLSRCQRFDFKPIPLELLAGHLATIAQAEGVAIEAPALELLARAASGGGRDAVSLLDQAMAYAGAAGDGDLRGGGITAQQVQSMLGLTAFGAVTELIDALAAADLPQALRLVHGIAAQGTDLRQFCRQLVELLRALLLVQSRAESLLALDEETLAAVRQRAAAVPLSQTVGLIKLFTQAEQGLKTPSAQPQLPLELAVVEALIQPPAAPGAVVPTSGGQPDGAAIVRAAPPAQPVQRPVVAAAPLPAVAPPPPPAPPLPSVPPEFAAPEPVVARVEPAAGLRVREAPRPDPVDEPPAVTLPDAPPAAGAGRAISLPLVQQRWRAALEDLRRSTQRSLEALLRDATPLEVEDGNVVVLQFNHRFHRDKVQDISNRIAVEKALGRVLSASCRVRCVLQESGESKLNGARSQPASGDPVVVKALRIWRAHILTPDEVAAVDALPVLPAAAVMEPKE